MSFLYGEPVTLLRRVLDPTPDVDGNDVYHDVPTVVTGAFDPAIGFERIGGMDQVSTQPQVLLPAGTVVGSVDAVMVRGMRYEVDGVANVWNSPFTGWTAGVVVPLKRVTG
jgi:hypothetical protein